MDLLNKKENKTALLYIKTVILTALTSCAYFLNSGTSVLTDAQKASASARFFLTRAIMHLENSFQEVNVFSLVLIIALFSFYRKLPEYKGNRLQKAIAFAVSSASMFVILICRSFSAINSWNIVFASKSALLVALFKALGYGAFVYGCIAIASNATFSITEKTPLKPVRKNIVLKYAAIILICWLPYMFLFYPGMITPDTSDQVAQIVHNPNFSWTYHSIIPLSEGVIYNNHHPIFSTFLLKIFVDLGGKIGYAVSFELLCILQCILFALTLSYVLFLMLKSGVKKAYINISLIFFAIIPFFPIFGMTAVKDTIYAIFYLLVAAFLYSLLCADKISLKSAAVFSVTLLIFMLLRNNSVYILILMVPVMALLLLKDKQKLLKICGATVIAILVFQIGFVYVLFPAFNISEGSKREALSVPFVQTARYISEHPEEITKEDEEVILNVLNKGGNLDEIRDNYQKALYTNCADSVKNMYNKYAEKEELISYFKLWLKQLKTHPMTYVQAYINLHYGWLIFKGTEFGLWTTETSKNVLVGEMLSNFDNFAGSLARRQVVTELLAILNKIPVTKPIVEFSSYTWLYLIMFIVAIKKKNKKAITVNMLFLLGYLTYFAGPIACLRYAFPMMCAAPFSVFITLKGDENG